jgi:Cysteine-rich CPCC
MTFQNVSKPTEKQPTYRCPCCGHLTLCGRAGYEICPVCFWEDDGQDSHDADEVRGRVAGFARRANPEELGYASRNPGTRAAPVWRARFGGDLLSIPAYSVSRGLRTASAPRFATCLFSNCRTQFDPIAGVGS